MIQFRKKILIYPQFQLLIVGVNAFLMIVGFILNSFEITRAISRFKELGKTIQLNPDHSFFKLIEVQSANLYSSLILSFLFMLGLSGFITLVLSHRLAGPIVRLKSYLKEIASTGAVPAKLQFRKGDYFWDIPEVVNEAFDAVKPK